MNNILSLKWARIFELFKIGGIDYEHIEILENLGVDSIRKLAKKIILN